MGPSNSSYLSNIAIVHGPMIMGEAEYMVKPSIPEIGRFPSPGLGEVDGAIVRHASLWGYESKTM